MKTEDTRWRRSISLRGLLEAAWLDGWNARGELANAPLGTQIAQKEIRRRQFLEPELGDLAQEIRHED